MLRLVQACSGLFKLAQACSSLLRLVPAFQARSGLVGLPGGQACRESSACLAMRMRAIWRFPSHDASTEAASSSLPSLPRSRCSSPCLSVFLSISASMSPPRPEKSQASRGAEFEARLSTAMPLRTTYCMARPSGRTISTILDHPGASCNARPGNRWARVPRTCPAAPLIGLPPGPMTTLTWPSCHPASFPAPPGQGTKRRGAAGVIIPRY